MKAYTYVSRRHLHMCYCHQWGGRRCWCANGFGLLSGFRVCVTLSLAHPCWDSQDWISGGTEESLQAWCDRETFWIHTIACVFVVKCGYYLDLWLHTVYLICSDPFIALSLSREQPIYTTRAHVFQIDPTTKKNWVPASKQAVTVSYFYDSTRNSYRIISVDGTKVCVCEWVCVCYERQWETKRQLKRRKST